MPRKSALILILILWAVAFLGAFIMWQLEAPNGSSFTRGLNRVATFASWQFGATVLAILAWLIGRKIPNDVWVRRASFVPLIALFLLLLGIMSVVAWAYFFGPT